MTPSIEVFQDELSKLESYNTDSFVGKSNVFAKSSAKVSSSVERNQYGKQLVGDTLLNHIATVDHEVCEAGEEDSFFVADLGEVYRAFQRWQKHLPQVQPHYAVKCNTDPNVIKLLGNLGASFDCASKNEIDTVLKLGFGADKIIYANPCKTNSFVRHARDTKIRLTTVDNAQELHKLQKYHPDCGILIRIATDDATAQCRLSTKFGCSVETALCELLPLARELGLKIEGVAFHVGSGAKDFNSIYKAIEDSRAIFDAAMQQYGYGMTTLDIGGGFEQETFEASSAMVNLALNKFFPDEFVYQNNISFIAEPGRFMVAKAFTLGTHIIARRDLSESLKTMNDIEAMIYINDGVYGNMNCILFDHYQPTAFVLTHKGQSLYGIENDGNGKGKHHFSIWGPTCDGLDCVSSKSSLMANVEVGDWLYFPNLGAYTSAATTSFNGFKAVANTIYVSSEDLSSYQY